MTGTRFALLSWLLVTLFAASAPAADNGFYLGASVGEARFELAELAEDVGGSDLSGDDTSYKVFSGYRFANVLAVEASYRDFGAVEESAGEVGTVAADLTSADVFAVAFLPLWVADVFVKAGMTWWDAELTADLGGLAETFRTDGSDPAFGVGFQVRLRSFAVRAEAEYFDVDGAENVYMISVGGSLTF